MVAWKSATGGRFVEDYRAVALYFAQIERDTAGDIVDIDFGRRLTRFNQEFSSRRPLSVFEFDGLELPAGEYVLSEVRFETNGEVGKPKLNYCYTNEAYGFTVAAGETTYLGRLTLDGPSSAIARRAGHQPIASRVAGEDPTTQRGWSYGAVDSTDVAPVDVSAMGRAHCSRRGSFSWDVEALPG